MKVLVFGGKGWIGGQFLKETHHDVTVATSRADQYVAAYQEINEVRPDCVISFLGRTYGTADGKLIPSIDYLELPGKLKDNMRDNMYAPYNLATICQKLGIHFVYLGTGCIYTYTNDKKMFTEDDEPNFFGSGYSTVKGYTDQLLRNFSTTLQLRIRMPVSKLVSGRNLIDKLVAYPNICSIPNSMTVLDDMWKIIDTMIEVKEYGVYNLTNPGTAEHDWILQQYKEKINPQHTWKLISYEEQKKFITSERSNNEMDTHKLEKFCKDYDLELLPIQTSIMRCIQRRMEEQFTHNQN